MDSAMVHPILLTGDPLTTVKAELCESRARPKFLPVAAALVYVIFPLRSWLPGSE